MKYQSTYTILLDKDNLTYFQEKDSIYKMIYHRICDYEPNYELVEFEVQSDQAGDLDLEVLLNTLEGVAIHEVGTRGFCTTDDNLEDLSDIYTWEGSGSTLMGDLLSSEERINLVKQIANPKVNSLDEEIYVKIGYKEKSRWIELELSKDFIFTEDFTAIRVGKKGTEETIWLGNFFSDKSGYFIAVLNYQEQLEDNSLFDMEEYSRPWDEDYDDLYGYGYGYHYDWYDDSYEYCRSKYGGKYKRR